MMSQLVINGLSDKLQELLVLLFATKKVLCLKSVLYLWLGPLKFQTHYFKYLEITSCFSLVKCSIFWRYSGSDTKEMFCTSFVSINIKSAYQINIILLKLSSYRITTQISFYLSNYDII